MSSGCRSSLRFVDARAPARAAYVSLYRWPASDAEFAKSVAASRRGRAIDGVGSGGGTRKWSAAAAAMEVDSYSCRQVYLRSYTFSRKEESVLERTLRRLKQRTAWFPVWLRRRRRSGVDGHDGGDTTRRRRKKKKKTKKTKKGTVREVACSAICLVFRRILHCAAQIHVLRQG